MSTLGRFLPLAAFGLIRSTVQLCCSAIGKNRPGAVVRCGGTEGPLADQKAVVRRTYLIAPVLTLNTLRTPRGSPMLRSGNSGSLINAAYRFRELPYSDNSQFLTDDAVP